MNRILGNGIAVLRLDKTALLSAGIFAFGLVAYQGTYKIDQSELGVHLRLGKIVGIEQSGGGLMIPFLDSMVKIDMRTVTWSWEKLNAYSADQQPADMHVSVTGHVDPTKVSELYSRFGGDVRSAVTAIISPQVNKQVKVVFGQITAVRAIQERAKLNQDAQAYVEQAIGDSPLVIESVQIENIDFSKGYVLAVEARMQAEVEVQKVQQQAMRELEQSKIERTRADVEAYKVTANAKAQAESRRLVGEAEALAIRAKGDALKDNPALTGLIIAERWSGTLPTTMVPGAGVPLLNLGK
jgi:regulator of protease activity HflC (stomatin/prohibitin superfamily)